MNFNTNFTRSPSYIRFKRAIARDDALEYLINLGFICQSERSIELVFADSFELGVGIGLPESVDAQLVMDQLINCGFMKPIEGASGRYLITFFEDNNRALISRWENGKQGGRPTRALAVANEPTF